MARIICIDENNAPVSLAEVAAWGGTGGNLTPGDYLFQVTAVEQKQTQNGKPQIQLSLEVVAGAETETHNGQKLLDWRMLGGKKGALGRLKSLLEACGVQLDAQGGFDDQDLIGREFWAEAYMDIAKKTDAQGTETEREVTKIRDERSAVEGGATDAPAAAAAPAPAAAAAAPAPAPAPAQAAAAPARAAAPTLTTNRGVGGSAPAGRRLPVPPRKG
jgi:pyruvate/2-oxoglutarate dehydrogenase complex dihydrolipoamide acyltransferase (E2) component